MDQNALKRQVAQAALQFVEAGTVLGVGTGSTVDLFIDALAASGVQLAGAVSSSERSTARLAAAGIRVLQATEVESLSTYIDGADEIDPQGHMIKGGGAALTREKIVADLAQRFVCIADASKCVAVLGGFPLPVEVIPMAVPRLIRRFAAIGGQAQLRAGCVTDNGQQIIDVRGLAISDPLALEAEISQWPGVVTVGIFARHRAQIALIGAPEGVRTLRY
jgi:ribose 5-phosphate isomerase A